jgi:hypothetical protein
MFYGLIIKFIVARKGKLLNPKNIPTTLAQIQVFNDMTQFYKKMNIHLDKLQFCFLKCHEFGINLNLKKCAFMIF